MGRAARAVVSDGAGGFAVRDVEVDDPADGEVLVEIRASGVCHTDHDLIGVPVPFVLGHEGAGVVLAVGGGVTDIAVGDSVLLSWSLPCGSCFQCVEGNHHLCVAFVDDEAAGFVSGIEITHPDKGTEMLLYELGVDEDYRRHGIGRSLAVALRDFAQSRGCTGMWVPTDADNEPAIAMYRSTRPDEDAPTRILWWDLSTEE